jgi:hypothetical protein
MMRVAVMAVIIIVNFAAQTTLLPAIAVLGVTPDTGLIIVPQRNDRNQQ